MSNFNKNDLIFAIIWLVFLLVLGLMLGFGLSFALTSSTSIEKDEPISVELYLDDPFEVESVATIEEPIEIKETLVAEHLYGPELYRFYIAQICEQYYPEVDPYIALAVLEIESRYQPNLTSSAGAVGLMQWIPRYHAWRMNKFHLNDMWDPYTNIIVGVDLLNDLFQSRGTWREALYGYNHNWSYADSVLFKANLLREGEYFG